ncbi:PspA/IM30 family protein [Lysinibacillus odysseyi]|uniref:Modulator protein n=1 Tax=Lysinibacillus odysseyi 34hs-1 = NBRC 100172 TaxID=1220589 RepID=A0A0A3JFN0_9BACI|nr:PspA/IM30 family protein [Lysinibacillus odysseyi]KGR85817.1 hypothetical protein CD32_08185 [Lysinibacillus odysseyi 34hs-1 = NBRC 100172]
MNLLQRFINTAEAKLHEMFDSAERKNPISMLNQYVRQAEKETEKVGSLVVRQADLKHKIATELSQVEKKLQKRTEQLQLAQQSEEKDLIDFTLSEVEAYKTRVDLLEQSLAEATAEHANLERQFEQMKHRLQDMKVRQLQLMSKENVAHAHYRLEEASSKQADLHANKFGEATEYIERISLKLKNDYEITTFEQRLAALERKE